MTWWKQFCLYFRVRASISLNQFPVLSVQQKFERETLMWIWSLQANRKRQNGKPEPCAMQSCLTPAGQLQVCIHIFSSSKCILINATSIRCSSITSACCIHITSPTNPANIPAAAVPCCHTCTHSWIILPSSAWAAWWIWWKPACSNEALPHQRQGCNTTSSLYFFTDCTLCTYFSRRRT